MNRSGFKMKTILSAVATTMLLTSAMPAMAWRATEWTLRDVRSSSRDTSQELRQLRNDFNRFAQRMGTDMRSSSAESSAYTDKSIDAIRRIADAEQVNGVRLEKQKIRAQAESGDMDVDPMACFIMDLFSGEGGTMNGVSGQGSYTGSSVMRELSTLSPGEEIAKTSEVANEIISWKGREDATTDFSILMDSPTIDLGAPVDSANNDAETVSDLVQSLLRNLIEPVPEVAVTADELTRPEGVDRATRIKAKRVRQSVALETLGMIINMSEPVVPSESVRALVEGTPYNRDIPDGMASELQAIDALVVSYYAPSEESRQKSVSSNAILQKILQVNSIQARMQFLSLELQRRQAAIDATRLAIDVEFSGR